MNGKNTLFFDNFWIYFWNYIPDIDGKVKAFPVDLSVNMAKKYRKYDPDQSLLLSPNLSDWLPDDHLAKFIDEVVDELDLSPIFEYYEQEERGNPPYHPAMMAKVLFYAYCIGIPSSRKIDKNMYEDVAFRYLGAGNFPDFRTISDFRKYI